MINQAGPRPQEAGTVENLKQVASALERLESYAARVEQSSTMLRDRLEDVLSPERAGAEKHAGVPPSTGDAPLASKINNIIDVLERSVYRFESIYDRVEL